MVNSKEWILSHTIAGVVGFLLCFVMCSVLLMPYSPFAVAAGYVWGPWRAHLILGVGIGLASACIFLVTHCSNKLAIQTKAFDSYAWLFNLTKKMQGDWKACAKLNLLLCFAPLPFAMHAYLFGFCECAFAPFVVVFEVGMLLHTAFCIDVGYATSQQFNATLGTDEQGNMTNQSNMSVLLGSISVMLLALLLASLASKDLIRAYGEPTTVGCLQNEPRISGDCCAVLVQVDDMPAIDSLDTLDSGVVYEADCCVPNSAQTTLRT